MSKARTSKKEGVCLSCAYCRIQTLDTGLCLAPAPEWANAEYSKRYVGYQEYGACSTYKGREENP
jgi:hypothetical protein